MSLNNKLISIGICAYNSEKYIREALDSAINQTHSNLEIIILNDGSQDSTKNIIESFNDSRIIYIELMKNKGISNGRQIVKSIAQGDYLVFLDSDDIFHKDRIEYLLNQALVSKSDITSDAYECIDESGNYLCDIVIPDYISKDQYFTKLIERNRMLPHPLISKKCYKNIDYDLRLKHSDDYDFWVTATLKGFTFSKTNEKKLQYRKVSGSLSSNIQKSLEETKMILLKHKLDNLIQIYKTRDFSEQEINYMACIYSIFINNYSQALQYAQKNWEKNNKDDRNFYLGTLFIKNEDYDKAIIYLKKHLKKYPNSPAGLNNMGIVIKNLEEKNNYFKQALEIFPTYNDAQINFSNNIANQITYTQIH